MRVAYHAKELIDFVIGKQNAYENYAHSVEYLVNCACRIPGYQVHEGDEMEIVDSIREYLIYKLDDVGITPGQVANIYWDNDIKVIFEV